MCTLPGVEQQCSTTGPGANAERTNRESGDSLLTFVPEDPMRQIYACPDKNTVQFEMPRVKKCTRTAFRGGLSKV